MAPTALLLVVLAVAALHAPAANAALSQEPPATPCAAAIVSFSPCLAHVAVVAPPALPSPAPTSACCAAFLRAVSAGDGEGGGGEGCLCHLLRDPLLLGFPVDAARLGALLPTCASAKTSAATAVEAEALFADKCRGEKSVPSCSLFMLVQYVCFDQFSCAICACCRVPVVDRRPKQILLCKVLTTVVLIILVQLL
uniref:Bifunctional inhibitor/plant lipid transfer protein/seed storage helical domain-containing protein n=1 Tax=Aegilops tauschii subsp. strangulata TaxID=200361 RepID=A0A453F0N1_AEGTS